MSTLALAIITALYVLLTRSLVVENRRMREALTDPKIFISFERSEPGGSSYIYFTIHNMSPSPAYDIKIEVNPDFSYTSCNLLLTTSFSQLWFVKDGLKLFGPNQKL